MPEIPAPKIIFDKRRVCKRRNPASSPDRGSRDDRPQYFGGSKAGSNVKTRSDKPSDVLRKRPMRPLLQSMEATMFQLTSENLTGLGGPMGTEQTWTNWEKFFTSMDAAKSFAQMDYRRNGRAKAIRWTKGKKYCNSGDLGFVMYHIKEVQTEA